MKYKASRKTQSLPDALYYAYNKNRGINVLLEYKAK